MDTHLLKRLSGYSATVASFLLLQKTAVGQIIYTDIVPDDTLSIASPIGPGEWYSLDLNNDGIVDYSVAVDIIYFEYAVMIGKYSNGSEVNAVAGVFADIGLPAYNVFKLDSLDTIDAGLNWVKPKVPKHSYMGNLLFVTSYPNAIYGYWNQGVEDGYLGLRIHVGSDKYYGWLRCDVAADASYIVIKDYACNSQPNKQIIAGEGAGCADNNEPNNTPPKATIITPGSYQGLIDSGTDRDYFKFSVSASQPNVKIDLTSLPKNYNIRLLNSQGQVIAQSLNPQKQDEEIVKNNLATGIYYIMAFPKDDTKFDTGNCYTLQLQKSNDPFKEIAQEFGSVTDEISVYPNPVSATAKISFELKENSVTALELFDLSGKKMQTVLDENLPTGEHEVTFDGSALAAGIYLLTLNRNGSMVTTKVAIK